MNSEKTTPWGRLLLAWVLMAVVMSVNGIIRELLLVPRLGPTGAGVVSAITGILLIQVVAWWGLLGTALGGPQLLKVSLVWTSLTVAFEFIVGRWIDGKPWSELIANYDLTRGRLWPVVLASLVIAPFLWGRRSQSRGARVRP